MVALQSQNSVPRLNRPTTLILNYDFNRSLAAHEELASLELGLMENLCLVKGGDHLFLAPPFIDSVADYILDHGVSGVSAKITDLTAYHRTPLLNICSKTAKSLLQYACGTLGYLELSLGYEP